MNAFETIFDVVSQSSDRLAVWAEQHQYMTRYYDLKEVVIHQVINELNYCSFTVSENLIEFLNGDKVVNSRIFELIQEFSKNIEKLKTRITQINNETSQTKLAVYLYLTTLEVHTLKAKAKLMMMVQEEQEARQIRVVSASQFSFVQR